MANILYTSHCPMCMVVEHKLKESNIPYEVCDLRASPSDVSCWNNMGQVASCYANSV